MIPLPLAPIGKVSVIQKISGNDAARRHLEDMGLTPGEPVVVLSSHDGNLIISIRETRIAVSREMASKIMV